MFCGTGSFSHMDDDGGGNPRPTTPTTAKKKGTGKNPYSARGLDKFSAVLNELGARRQKILSQVGAQGVPVVLRFMYKSTQDWIPVVVKLPPPPPPEKHATSPPSKASSPPRAAATKNPASASAPTASSDNAGAHAAQGQGKKGVVVKKRHAFSWGSAVGMTRQEMGGCLYWAVVLALLLLCLTVSGKTFAICCTTVLLYVLPRVTSKTAGCGGGLRRSMQGREYRRRPSDKRLAPADAAA